MNFHFPGYDWDTKRILTKKSGLALGPERIRCGYDTLVGEEIRILPLLGG